MPQGARRQIGVKLRRVWWQASVPAPGASSEVYSNASP